VPSPSFSSTARDQARDILSKAPYRTTATHTPRPLAGLFHALGRALNAAFGRPARWLYHHLLLHIGHGFTSTFGGWWIIVLGVLAVALGIAVGVQVVGRRTRVTARLSSTGSMVTDSVDPAALERSAAEAESSGDHETAVRLRFRAGLLRLQRGGVIAHPEAETDRQLAVVLHSPTFDTLSGRHERIVYAGDHATSTDAAEARTGWPQVLSEVRPRETIDSTRQS
jgi:hypothetical protein